ncbi:MAG: flagellar assembly protein FliW [Acidimicrobiia bacterium]
MTTTQPSPTEAPVELRFAEGIPGFPDHTRFTLVELADDGAFQLLQSLDDENVAMIVTTPWLFFPDYEMEIPDDAQAELGLGAPEDAVVLSAVTLDASQERFHVNLLGPFVVHRETGHGRQLILSDSDHPVRATVDLTWVN